MLEAGRHELDNLLSCPALLSEIGYEIRCLLCCHARTPSRGEGLAFLLTRTLGYSDLGDGLGS